MGVVPGGKIMEAIAKARFARYAPRKVNQVLEVIRGKKVNQAYNLLKFIPKSSVALVEKTLKSAVSNYGPRAPLDQLFIQEAWVGRGPFFKRIKPGPRGRSMMYKRRTCHLTIIVSDK